MRTPLQVAIPASLHELVLVAVMEEYEEATAPPPELRWSERDPDEALLAQLRERVEAALALGDLIGQLSWARREPSVWLVHADAALLEQVLCRTLDDAALLLSDAAGEQPHFVRITTVSRHTATIAALTKEIENVRALGRLDRETASAGRSGGD